MPTLFKRGGHFFEWAGGLNLMTLPHWVMDFCKLKWIIVPSCNFPKHISNYELESGLKINIIQVTSYV